MSEQSNTGETPERRRLLSIVLQVSGLSDIVLGLAFAAFGPGFIGDPTLDTIVMAAGGVLALFGLGIWWWGRTRYGPKAI